MKTYRHLPVVLLLFLTALLVVPAPVRAATLTVTSAANSGAGTLRNTIAAAALGDTITFAPALNGQTIVLTSGEININKNLNILGPGPANLAVSGNGSSRVFYCNFVSSATLIAGLTFTNGNGVGAIASGAGGAILNAGPLTVSNCTFTGNAATEGSGIFNQAGSVMVKNSALHHNSASIRGGGIHNSSGATLTLDGCVISNNVATANGGGIRNDGSLTVTNCTLSGNRVTGVGDGGGIASFGPVTLLGSAFNGNLATNGGFGGGLYNSYSGALTVSKCTFSGNAATEGGGICTESGTLTVNSSTLSGNSAVDVGGGIASRFGSLRVNNCLFSTNVTTSGFQAGSGGGIYQVSGGSLAASNCTFNGNVAIAGGGIGLDGSTGTVNGCVFNGNSGVTTNANRASTGGGIKNGISTLTVNHSTFSGNSAIHSGGGIQNIGVLMVNNCTLDGNFTTAPDRYGGGIANLAGGTLTMSNSTLSGNSAGFQGGGLFNLQSAATVINSTFSANSALEGGGIASATAQSLGAHLTIANSTFSDNSAVRRGASLHIQSLDGSLTISHTLLARPQGTTNAWISPGSLGTVTNRGFNLADDASASAFATQVADLKLGPLADNGGLTLTHALLPGSPAINAGTNANIASLPNDQRGPGFPRRYGARVDVGAYELQPPVLACPGDLTTTNTPGQCGAFVAFSVATDSPVTCVPASGSLFPVGTNLVTCTATNAVGTNTCAFKITARDIEAPVLACPASSSTSAPDGSNSERVYFNVSATDNCAVVATNCVPPSGSFFPRGLTPVTCTALDAAGNSGMCTFDVSVCTSNITVTSADPYWLAEALESVCPGGTITFAPALNGQTIVLTGLGIRSYEISKSVNILGPGATNLAISGNGGNRVFSINPGVTCTIAGLTIRDGNASRDGFGGGILNFGTLTVSNCTISSSEAEFGGGICNNNGTLLVQNSTIDGNSAIFDGGGILNFRGTLTVQNTTVSGNSAASEGGGIYNETGTLTFQNSTITDNRADRDAGGLYANGIERLTNCIVAGNFRGSGTMPGDIGGSGVNSAAYNLIGSFGLGATNGNIVLNNTRPITSILDTNLAFNGGPTRTHSLVAGSPARDAGTNVTSLPAFDQRGPGFPRVSGAAVDIGAYELQLSAPVLAGCPSNVATNVAHGTNTRAVTWPAPTATGSPAPVVACQPPSGNLFGVGSTLVTCTATNSLGTNTCSFTVTVCAMNIVVTSAANSGAGSLRTAISNACPGGTITLPSQFNGQTIVLTNGELVIGKNLTILGPGATNLVISGNGLSRVFAIEPGVTCVLKGLTLARGFSPDGGGAILMDRAFVTIQDCVISGNVAQRGGGICVLGSPGLRESARLTVQSSTLNGNTAQDGPGGSIYISSATVEMVNSTVSGSVANSGGGILNDNGALSLQNCTFSGNSVVFSGGGIYNADGTLTLSRTLLAKGASGVNLLNDLGPVNNLGFNFSDDASAGSFATQVADLKLAPLTNNGGSTPTHRLLSGSPAIDAGPGNLPNAWQITDASGDAGSLNFTNTLSAAQKLAATNSGWHFTVVSRMVEGSGGDSPAQFMTYGHGDRRFIVGWDLDASGRLTARFYGAGGNATNLTGVGEGTSTYHQHELVYSPVTQKATYLLDGEPVFTWAGLAPSPDYNGQAFFGAAAGNGRGQMNYHHVQFAITGQGTVSEYFAGYAGNPAIAPDPVSQGWTRTWSVPANTDVSDAPVSPDAVALPDSLIDALGLLYDQRGTGFVRVANGRIDSGAYEVQQPKVTQLGKVSQGFSLSLTGEPNETLNIEWNADAKSIGWQPLTTGTTDASGSVQIIDSTPSAPRRFYRTVRP